MTITRRIETAEGWRKAIYSDCESYRYALTATWDADRPQLLYVMLNPSKATELANDPTIERCERRARLLNYGAISVVNIFGLRATSPPKLKVARSPEGPENIAHIRKAVAQADTILAAWGVHGAHQDQGARVLGILRELGAPLFHLGLTKHGHPRHPLYVSYKTKPEPWL